MSEDSTTFTKWLKGSHPSDPGHYVAQAMEADPNLEQALELAFRQYAAYQAYELIGRKSYE
jgi:hypothetical protein